MCASLAQRKISLDVILAEGDLVAVRSTWSGIYTGTFRGTRVDGKKVSIVYSNIYRVINGKICENWANVDRLSLAEQFGMQLGGAGASIGQERREARAARTGGLTPRAEPPHCPRYRLQRPVR